MLHTRVHMHARTHTQTFSTGLLVHIHFFHQVGIQPVWTTSGEDTDWSGLFQSRESLCPCSVVRTLRIPWAQWEGDSDRITGSLCRLSTFRVSNGQWVCLRVEKVGERQRPLERAGGGWLWREGRRWRRGIREQAAEAGGCQKYCPALVSNLGLSVLSANLPYQSS